MKAVILAGGLGARISEESSLKPMGEAVRIVGLARNPILLSGLRPDVDVKVEYRGRCPREKLYEER